MRSNLASVFDDRTRDFAGFVNRALVIARLAQSAITPNRPDRHRERQRSDPDSAAAAIPKTGSLRSARDDDPGDSK